MSGIDLTDQVGVVTGGGGDLGRATAMALAAAGSAVVAADIDGAAAAETAEVVMEAGGRAMSMAVDVAAKVEVDDLADQAIAEFGRVDSWSNVAGIMRTQYAVDVSEDDLDAVLDVNLKGVLYGCQAGVRVMTPAGSGSIVNVVSAIIDAAVPGMAGYAISKAGATILTKCLALEVARSGLRVNAVAPGWTASGMTRGHAAATGAVEPEDDEAFEAHTAKQARWVPLGRNAEPRDVADTIVYLASPLADFVTGQIMRPHGGVTMPW